MKEISVHYKVLKKGKGEVSMLNIFQALTNKTAKNNNTEGGNDGNANKNGNNNNKKFEGICHFCGIKGHRKNECRKWENERKKTCNNCGKKGHSSRTADPIKTIKTMIAAEHSKMVAKKVPTVPSPMITNHHLPTLNAS